MVGTTENYLMWGPPWDTDGIDQCPPIGTDDVRCEWHKLTGGDPNQEN